MDLIQLNDASKVWGKNKGILEKGTPIAQMSKSLEEAVELITNVATYNKAEKKDAVGDLLVTFCLQSTMQSDNDMFLEYANGGFKKTYESDSKNLGKATDLQLCGAIVKAITDAIQQEAERDYSRFVIETCIILLAEICIREEWSFSECWELAYNVIAKRKGQMIDGQFVKEN